LLTVAPSWKITKNAQARNAYGTMAQELVCAALHLTPIPINGNYDCCFDAILDDTYYEIKSVKQRGGKLVVYDWRMRKERESNAALNYAILLHNVRGSDGSELLREFVESKLKLLVIPAEWVHEMARECQRRSLNTEAANPRMGYNRKGYRDGYRNVPVTKLMERATSKRHVCAHYAGIEFNVELHTTPPAEACPF
jgi:hypothetical protein